MTTKKNQFIVAENLKYKELDRINSEQSSLKSNIMSNPV